MSFVSTYRGCGESWTCSRT